MAFSGWVNIDPQINQQEPLDLVCSIIKDVGGKLSYIIVVKLNNKINYTSHTF